MFKQNLQQECIKSKSIITVKGRSEAGRQVWLKEPFHEGWSRAGAGEQSSPSPFLSLCALLSPSSLPPHARLYVRRGSKPAFQQPPPGERGLFRAAGLPSPLAARSLWPSKSSSPVSHLAKLLLLLSVEYLMRVRFPCYKGL